MRHGTRILVVLVGHSLKMAGEVSDKDCVRRSLLKSSVDRSHSRQRAASGMWFPCRTLSIAFAATMPTVVKDQLSDTIDFYTLDGGVRNMS